MPHRRHTIASLGGSNAKLLGLLREEDRLGKTIHIPKQIFNPEADRWQYHWCLRGHDRQITFEQVEFIMTYRNTVSTKFIPSECAFSR
jgi:hypothetical protein